ncbi:hypothetical protein T484DRAFT_1793375 [Baffinella frigidus]|nr:hypothetical protein T484DRAFT_1793375 [Cryptophyta sp. CCMP2293]
MSTIPHKTREVKMTSSSGQARAERSNFIRAASDHARAGRGGAAWGAPGAEAAAARAVEEWQRGGAAWGAPGVEVAAAGAVEEWQERVRRVVEEEVEPATRTCRDAAQRTRKVEDMILEWREQPGQYAAPWVKVDGRSMMDWMLALRCLVPDRPAGLGEAS